MIHLPGANQLLALAAPDLDAAQIRAQYVMMEKSWLISAAS
jgi:hypothetical protein